MEGTLSKEIAIILSFCFFLIGSRFQQQGGQQQPRAFFGAGGKSGSGIGGYNSDLSSGYASNFKTEASAASMQSIESILINTMFKRMITLITDNLTWIKSAENR